VNSIVLGSPAVSAVAAMLIVLVVGDLASTFLYHVPQHVWGKLHLRTHHDRKRSYWDHAVLSKNPAVLLDGLLGALPYIAVALLASRLSLAGAIVGLALGQCHVLWRHTVEIGWKSPAWLVGFARLTGLVLPEDHNGHHQNPEIEFGDIFRFYDVPARSTIAWLRAVAPRRRSAAAMRRFRARDRRSAAALRALKQRKSPTG
jgi:hypothetical protein